MKNRNPRNDGEKSNDSFIAAEWNYPIELASTKLWESDISTKKHRGTRQKNARNSASSPYPGPCLVRLKTLRCHAKCNSTGKFSEVQEVDRQSRKFMATTLHSQSRNGFACGHIVAQLAHVSRGEACQNQPGMPTAQPDRRVKPANRLPATPLSWQARQSIPAAPICDAIQPDMRVFFPEPAIAAARFRTRQKRS